MKLRFLIALALFVLAASATLAAEPVVPTTDPPDTAVVLEGQPAVPQAPAADPFFGNSQLEAAASSCKTCDDLAGCGVNEPEYHCCNGVDCRCEGSTSGKLRCCISVGKPCILPDPEE